MLGKVHSLYTYMYMYTRVYLTWDFFLTIDERSIARCRALLNAVIKGHSCCSYFYRYVYARTRVDIYRFHREYIIYIIYIFIEVDDINVA